MEWLFIGVGQKHCAVEFSYDVDGGKGLVCTATAEMNLVPREANGEIDHLI